MKSFIRSLNIQERKSYVYAICFSFFQCISAFLIKTLAMNHQIGSLSLICQSGCIISIICFYRIVMTFRNVYKREQMEIENIPSLLYKGFFHFLSFVFFLVALYTCKMSTLFVIIRLYPFLIMITEYFIADAVMEKFEVIGFAISLISCAVVVFPALGEGDSVGIFSGIMSVGCLVFSSMHGRYTHGTSLDFFLLSIGIYSAGIGGILMIMTQDKMECLSIANWIYLILNAFTTYYSNFFLLKVIQKSKHLDKIVMFNMLSILITLLLGVIFFHQSLQTTDLAILLILLNTIFFSQSVITKSRNSHKNSKEDFSYLGY